MEVKRFSKEKALFEGFSLFAILILLVVTVFTSLNTGSSLLLVLIGFSPTLITIIFSIIIYEELAYSKVVMWFIPFVLTGLFFFVLTSQKFLNSNIEVGSLAAINIFLSLVYLTIFFLFIKLIISEKKSRPKEIVKEKVKVIHHHHAIPPPVSIQEYVASIEDKSKALNFVIGRVYNKYHGGTKEMRDRINVPSEWYNEFSDNLLNNKVKDKKKAVDIVEMIESRLNLLIKSETEVFGSQIDGLKNLIRTEDGSNTIIDVLVKNDKDPVISYYKGALEFCRKLKDTIAK